ncbi:sugar O-acetyltransferase [Candidatus Mycobacterium wuenschmannii]|uniref:Sugar O-acetyltransferase n=1 Tax=Candidatus Mycobacterium wuenschmannii TaxID=3027808 RepID=A0ABY8W1K9_9MYCO|nr:sugar O-acetyltransferase [Candidatus Mycobacterium wuenschmannii]WIM88327.1 sugar O-acetyltransferase [Candidatus Mycobacterium wuenschmannii]
MTTQRELMLSGAPYRADDPELSAARRECQRVLARFNAGESEVLQGLLGSLGEGSEILPRFLCDYGEQISVGAGCFVNYDAVFLDCAAITIGRDVQIGPRVQLLTALHPVDDHESRRAGWESALPIAIGDNVWLAAGVIVCAGVSIGDNTVIGAGSVVTRDVPPNVLAAGNPCRVIRSLEP